MVANHTVEFLTPTGSLNFTKKMLDEALDVTLQNIKLLKEFRMITESRNHEIQLMQNKAGDKFIVVHGEFGTRIIYDPPN